VAQVVSQVARRLAARGHDVHVATSRRHDEPATEIIDNVVVHRFAAGGSELTGLTGEIESYRALVAEPGWDVIFDHCVQHWAFDSLLDQLRTDGERHILVTHGIRMEVPEHRPYHDHIAEVFPCLGAWACVSRVTSEVEFAERYGFGEPHLLQNGVALEEWSGADLDVRTNWGIGTDSWAVNVSNHNPHKGHAIVHALARKHADARFTIIGKSYPMARFNLGDIGVRGGCWHRCRLQSLRSGCRLIHTATRAETRSAFYQADVIVAPSSWEANSIVLLEAMAAATPWIAFDVGSARLNAGGLVAKDATEMSHMLQHLLNDASLRAELGAAGRAAVEAKHSWDRIVEDYETLATSVAATAGAR
jgi:glycosyltransferase involved in cell wall biosynthesis